MPRISKKTCAFLSLDHPIFYLVSELVNVIELFVKVDTTIKYLFLRVIVL